MRAPFAICLRQCEEILPIGEGGFDLPRRNCCFSRPAAERRIANSTRDVLAIMRILLMTDAQENPNAGASGTEFQTVAALRALGHEVDTVWADGLSHFIRHGSTHGLVEQPIAYHNAMLKRLRQRTYDAIHVNQPHGYLAARALRALPAPPVFIHRSHGFEPRVLHDLAPWQTKYPTDTRHFFRRALSRLYQHLLETHNQGIVKYADGHIVSASQCKDFLTERYAVSPERIAVIAQAPPTQFQDAPARPMTADRLRRILYVGQFAFVKAPMVLAGAVERILESRPDASMTWVCDSRHHAMARDLFHNKSILDRVSFLPWRAQSELRDIYDQHGVFLFPSFFEGFGKAFLEAMSRGLVVVAADNGGMRDVITHGEDGLLHPTGDIDQLAMLAAVAMADLDFACRLSSSARLTSLRYTWQTVARETAAFYQALISMRASK
jgi:glycosyltransferase involved in cell wall biosynthesis